MTLAYQTKRLKDVFGRAHHIYVGGSDKISKPVTTWDRATPHRARVTDLRRNVYLTWIGGLLPKGPIASRSCWRPSEHFLACFRKFSSTSHFGTEANRFQARPRSLGLHQYNSPWVALALAQVNGKPKMEQPLAPHNNTVDFSRVSHNIS